MQSRRSDRGHQARHAALRAPPGQLVSTGRSAHHLVRYEKSQRTRPAEHLAPRTGWSRIEPVKSLEGRAMIACPACGHNNPEGAPLCESCGAYLHTGGTLSTDELGSEQVSRPGPSFFSPHLEGGSAADMSLVLISPEDGRRFALEPHTQTALLGRSDPKARLVVNVDLTGQDGQPHGVSRRHAR